MDPRSTSLRSEFQRRLLLVIVSSALAILFVALTAFMPAGADDNERIADAGPSNTSGKWPDETNTGVPVGTTLVPSGNLVITQPGAVIAGLDIQGAVDIDAPNVTLKDSRIRAARFDVVRVKPGITGVIIQDCEIDGIGAGNDGSNGIRGAGTFLRNNIHRVENGITLDGGATVQDNYIHDLLASGSPHYDGIQIDGGVSNVLIRHNTIINPHAQTAAIMIDNYFGPIDDITVDNNRLIGGGYTVYSDGQFSGGPITAVTFTNNRLGKGRWGYSSFVGNKPTWRNNVDDVTGRNLGSR
jgi:hypothetical protein